MTTHQNDQSIEPEYPDFEKIIENCKVKMKLKFFEYGNSWNNISITDKWWKKRLMTDNGKITYCTCGLRDHIQKMIDKCKIKKERIMSGEDTFPIESLADERYEYLDDFQAKLQFMLDHTEKEQIV